MPAPLRILLPLAALLFLCALSSAATPADAADKPGIHDPRIGYHTATPRDPFSLLLQQLRAGQRQLRTDSEQDLLESLLETLRIPASSQMLVFSATSFQTGLISVRNPRALYFNEDTYVGYVPGGRLEIVSVDPQIGSVFHLLDRWAPGQIPRSERSERCMNCHAPRKTGAIPLLLVESMIPSPTGGGEKSYRGEVDGHSIPHPDRMGGWVVTGAPQDYPHQGNAIIKTADRTSQRIPVEPGSLFDWNHYPVRTSDVLAHLLHEHQVGFINRCTSAAYKARTLGTQTPGPETQRLAADLVRYLLFTDEAPLPQGGVPGDPSFKAAFLSSRRPTKDGASLKDLDLQTHLLRHRCSYMIYSQSFTGLPRPLKQTVYILLDRALREPGRDSAHLPLAERAAIRTILRETVTDLPQGWGTAPMAAR